MNAILQARRAEAVTPNDNDDIPNPALSGTTTKDGAALYIGGLGDVRVILVGNDTPVTFTAVQVGTFMPIRATRVLETGTSATNIVALW